MAQDQIVTATRHQHGPRAHHFACNPDPTGHLANVGLPHVEFLVQVVLQPFFDEAQWSLGLWSGLLLLADTRPQPGNGSRRGLPGSQKTADVVQGLAVITGAVIAGPTRRRELFAHNVGWDVLVRLPGLG